MTRAILAILAVAAAAAWLVYEHSLPARVVPGPFVRDASSLAIGAGVYLFGRFLMARAPLRAPLPAARTRA